MGSGVEEGDAEGLRAGAEGGGCVHGFRGPEDVADLELGVGVGGLIMERGEGDEEGGRGGGWEGAGGGRRAS